MDTKNYSAVAAADNARLEDACAWYRYAIDGILYCAKCGTHEMANGKPKMRAWMLQCPICAKARGTA